MGVAADQRDRALGALLGLAMGDALGMPGQTLSRAEIGRLYGRIEGFVAPVVDHPVSHGLVAGQVTDDTEQALLLAHRLIAGAGRIDEAALARDLLDWEADVKARGLRDLLGPSTKAALDAMLAGTPAAEAGRGGTTNGAAMRIAPVGIATAPAPVGALVDRVEQACRMTHFTGEAVAGAVAVAAVISAGVEGRGFEAALDLALEAAGEGQARGHGAGVDDMARRIAAALEFAAEGPAPEAFADRVGNSVATHQSVPAAFGLVRLAGGDPWRAGLLAANIGDDTDTIGAIACAMAGACAGAGSIPAEARRVLEAANRLELNEVADALLALRMAEAPAPLRAAGP